MAKVVDLINSGLISAGAELYWARKVAKENHVAIVNQDGSITTSEGVKHKTPSGAAKHLNGNKPVDGWLAWKVKDSQISLADLRAKLD